MNNSVQSSAEDVLKLFYLLPPQEQTRFCQSLLSDTSTYASKKYINLWARYHRLRTVRIVRPRFVRPHFVRPRLKSAERQTGLIKALVSELNYRGDLIRKLKVKPRKKGRNFLIRDLLKRGMEWKEIRKYLLEHHPEWATVKKTGKEVSLKALKNDHKAWLKSNH